MGGPPEEAHGMQQGLTLGGPIQFPRPVVDAFAGAVAGGVARVAIAPLDVIKIRFQVQLEPLGRGQVSRDGVNAVVRGASKYTGVLQAARSIFQEEGIRGLWRGTVPGLILVMPYTAIQFTVMLRFKTLVAGSTKGVDHLDLSPLLSYVGGAVAGSAATLGSYPFDLLRTTLAAQGNPQKYPTMRAAAVDIFRRRGIRGLYAGLTPTLIEIIPYAGIQFGAYDSLKRAMMAYNARKYGEDGPAHPVGAANLTTPQHFMIGLAAGLIAKTATHPLDVIKKRFQVRGLERHPSYGKRVDETVYRDILSTARHIIQTEGVRGMYKGIWPSVIKAAPNAAIIFAVYEKVSHWLEPLVNHTEGERSRESRPH